MDQALQAQLTAMRNEVQASPISDDGKQTALWCLGQLPALYSKFRMTNENRYGEEIARLVRGVMAELAKSKTAPDETPRRTMTIPERLQQFHEKFGLPTLALKLPTAPTRRSPKLGVAK